jgi:fluoroacetyl-CoA thioesterase
MGAELQLGLTSEVAEQVTTANVASTLGSGDLPVYATPAMIALMEAAAVQAVADHLAPQQTTVGVQVDVHHLAATPLGQMVRATAHLVAVAGRRLNFEVVADDEQERIGHGVHERVIVDRLKFMQRAEAKQRGSGMMNSEQ